MRPGCPRAVRRSVGGTWCPAVGGPSGGGGAKAAAWLLRPAYETAPPQYIRPQWVGRLPPSRPPATGIPGPGSLPRGSPIHLGPGSLPRGSPNSPTGASTHEAAGTPLDSGRACAAVVGPVGGPVPPPCPPGRPHPTPGRAPLGQGFPVKSLAPSDGYRVARPPPRALPVPPQGPPSCKMATCARRPAGFPCAETKNSTKNTAAPINDTVGTGFRQERG